MKCLRYPGGRVAKVSNENAEIEVKKGAVYISKGAYKSEVKLKKKVLKKKVKETVLTAPEDADKVMNELAETAQLNQKDK